MPQLSRRALLAALAGGTVAAATGGLAGCDGDRTGPAAGPPTNPFVGPSGGSAEGAAHVLVLYDTTGEYGRLGELYAIQTANLVSHFGTWEAIPVARYGERRGGGHTAVIYVGSTFDEPLPAAFLTDVAAATVPVIWLGANIWQLSRQHPELSARLGFSTGAIDTVSVEQVRYRGTTLSRDPANKGGLVSISVVDPDRAATLAEAIAPDGTSLPWAVRAGSLTYVSELPYVYSGHDDRYLAFADLLFDVLAPKTAVRHRALVRIEDAGPATDPAALRAIGDYLGEERVPFSVAVYAEHRDATAARANKPLVRTLSAAPALVSALKYLVARGGTLVMHGYSHGYPEAPNPYGSSGDDYEFYRARLGSDGVVVMDRPVDDGPGWITERLTAARREWTVAGLPVPRVWEFPHYAAGPADYRAVSAQFAARYESPMYFTGALTGAEVDYTRWTNQFFPYLVRDVYGGLVIPESLGNVELEAPDGHALRTADDIITSARRQLVIRDGVASFFYHPFLGVSRLRDIVEGIRALGYTFVAAESLLPPAATR